MSNKEWSTSDQHLYELLDANRMAIGQLMEIIVGMHYSETVNNKVLALNEYWTKHYSELEEQFGQS